MLSPSRSARVGASISLLGSASSLASNIIMSGIHPASLGPQVLWLVLPPAIITLAISAAAWLRMLPRWLLILSCGISILGVLLQALTYYAHLIFSCFDVCIPTRATISFWILLGLGGFLLSSIGAFLTLNGSRTSQA